MGGKSIVGQAWEFRNNFAPVLWICAPGSKHYANSYYNNHRYSFANISITGEACTCRCDHCEGRLLHTMIPATTPAVMRQVIDGLADKGCRGILVSGGANARGEVPLLPFTEGMAYARQKGFKVLVHCGLLNQGTALGLKEAGVDQVLIDVIGDEKTIHQVYHLQRRPEDYLRSMIYCREAGLNIAPHVVIGLHYGNILGEKRALEMIRKAEPETVVLVVLTPAPATAMADVKPPAVDEVADIIAAARVLNPAIAVTLGCAKPPGPYKRQVEARAIDCGVNGLAYPDESTIDYAVSRGLKTEFTEDCCSLVGHRVKMLTDTKSCLS